MEHGFNWLSFVPGLEHVAHHVPMAVLVATILVITTMIASLQLSAALKSEKNGEAALVPPSSWTFRNFFEIVAEKLYALTESVIGHHDTPRYFPIIGTLFVFIFVSNLFGLIPGFLPPTDNINTTLAAGLFVFIFYNIEGFRSHGFAYLKHFLGPVWWLAPLMLVIELVGHLARPLSLALRLRGNIAGDHMVLGIFSDLTPYLIPSIFYGLGLFVSFIQAFVFCLLTMVYISLSTSHDH